MSQKAWMNAYTKGSKDMQARLAKIHKNNPEFQDFVKKHGFGGNLSKKQSELQSKGSVQTVKPVTPASPEKNQNLDREALIKAAAVKLRNRRLANSNRVAFGGELGGDFSMHRGGWRRYSESVEESVAANFRKIVPGLGKLQAKNRAIDLDNELTKGIQNKTLTRIQRMAKAKHIERFARVASGEPAFKRNPANGFGESVDEDIAYKDGTIAMYRGGWIAKRDGKKIGTTMPSDKHARELLDATHKSLAQKTMTALKSKAKSVMQGFAARKLATESAANRRRIRSWDSAVLPVEHDHPLHTEHPKKKLDALRAAGKHVEARELERSWLRKAMAKAKTENSK
jgi:hypothetical protein